MNEEINENNEEEKELRSTYIECRFSAHPEEFNACLSVYNDLRCPKYIDWACGKL